LGRFNQTTHKFNKPSERVTITNPIHPLHGQVVSVRSLRQLGKSVRVIVEHPQGGLVSLPVAETSLEQSLPCAQVEGRTPLFEPKNLQRLAQWIETKAVADTKANSSCQQDTEVVKRKIDATTAGTEAGAARRRQRPEPTLNQSDGQVSGQNALSGTKDTQGEPNG
jgi:hypothetical protein